MSHIIWLNVTKFQQLLLIIVGVGDDKPEERSPLNLDDLLFVFYSHAQFDRQSLSLRVIVI